MLATFLIGPSSRVTAQKGHEECVYAGDGLRIISVCKVVTCLHELPQFNEQNYIQSLLQIKISTIVYLVDIVYYTRLTTPRR